MWWLIIVALLAYFMYTGLIKPMGHWKKRKIPYSKPWPLLGNMAPFVFRKRNVTDMQKDMYNEFPDKRYNGIFALTSPQILIRDPDLIKQVTIKDFDYFINRAPKVENEVDPLLSKNLVALHGQQWRDMRATLSPSFTSSKMKFMFNLLSDCAEQFTLHFQNQTSKIISVEMKDVASRFTNDAIATAAFGVTVDSLKEPDNEFFLMGKDSISLGVLKVLRLLGHTMFPALMKLLKIPVFPTSLSNFFRRIVKETIEVREKNGIVRPDMIHLLLESRKGKLTNLEEPADDAGFAVVEESALGKAETHKKLPLTDDEMTAQALIFFFAGFDTSSTLMSFMSHELAVNPDIQEKLQKEIDETLERCGGKVTYEALLGMKYLDAVISESLRKWPPSIGLGRLCEKDYVIEPKLPEEEPFTVDKGTMIIIPIAAVHYDPKYFPNPEKFDPERFSDENKSNIVPGTYLPFGIGPRNCIASRFALMEIKILFFHLLSKFDIVPTEKTPIPLVISKKKVSLAPDEGFWVGFQHRKSRL